MTQPTIAQKEVTLHILKRFGIRMNKKLGQNFLIDEHVVNSMLRQRQLKLVMLC